MSLARKSVLGAGFDQYKSNEVATVSQGKLIVMLYEGAIRFLNVAAGNMNPRKYDLVNTNIIRAQDIITELMLSLNLETGGKMASDLLSIYVYLKKRLLEANMKKDAAILDEVVKHMSLLKESWDEVAKKESNGQIVMPELQRGSGFSIKG